MSEIKCLIIKPIPNPFQQVVESFTFIGFKKFNCLGYSCVYLHCS